MIQGEVKIINTPTLQLRKYALKGLRKGMFLVEAKVKRGFGTIEGRPKVRTGNLRRSIKAFAKVEKDAAIGTVGSQVIYARILELGGKRARGGYQKAMPYIRPEMESNIETVKDYIRDAIIKGNK